MNTKVHIERLRDLIQQMREENSVLRAQNHQLREQLTSLQRAGLAETTSAGLPLSEGHQERVMERVHAGRPTVEARAVNAGPMRSTLTGQIAPFKRETIREDAPSGAWQRSFDSADDLKIYDSDPRPPRLGKGV